MIFGKKNEWNQFTVCEADGNSECSLIKELRAVEAKIDEFNTESLHLELNRAKLDLRNVFLELTCGKSKMGYIDPREYAYPIGRFLECREDVDSSVLKLISDHLLNIIKIQDKLSVESQKLNELKARRFEIKKKLGIK